MSKMLVAGLLVLGLVGCASTPMSSIYDGAKPSHVIANGDGSTTFEFMFPYADFDGNMAMQRINEYLNSYTKDQGLTGYEILNVDARVIEKTSTGSTVGAALQNWGSGLQGSTQTHEARKDQFVRALVQVKFKT